MFEFIRDLLQGGEKNGRCKEDVVNRGSSSVAVCLLLILVKNSGF